MNYLSVCSGIEAATVAWKPLGFEPVGVSEIEQFPNGVLDHHYPEVTNLGDMTNYKEWNIERPEIIVGGTPCQSFSIAGLRQGMADPRGNLTLVFLGVVAHFRPTWVVWENVPGVLSLHKGRPFGSFLGGLAELGYGWVYRVLDAQYFGVPQRRRRVFVVGHSSGQFHRAAAVLFERESMCWDSPPSRATGQRVAPSVTGGVPFSCTGNERVECEALVTTHRMRGFGDYVDDGSASAIKCRDYKDHTDLIAFMPGQGAKAGSIAAAEELAPTLKSTDSGTNRTPAVAIRMRAGKPGGGKGALVSEKLSLTLAGSNDQTIIKPAYGVMTGQTGSHGLGVSEEVMPTLNSVQDKAVAFAQNTRDEVRLLGGDGQIAGALAAEPGMKQTTYIQHHSVVRRLTEIECERFQGFPDNYTQIPWKGKPAEDCPMGPRYKALGNSMAVPVMRWIGERIKSLTST